MRRLRQAPRAAPRVFSFAQSLLVRTSASRRKCSIPDDKTKIGPQDASRINVHEKYEVEYWSKKFNVTPEQLKAAVARVGVSAKAVETELSGR
jgi:hypothetical protein